MTFWDRLRAALMREKQDAAEMIGEATERGNRTLDSKERELQATPEERLVIEQERAHAADADYDELRRRIEGSSS